VDNKPWTLTKVKEGGRLSPSKKTVEFDSPETLSHELAHMRLRLTEFPYYEEEAAVMLYCLAKGWAFRRAELDWILESYSIDAKKSPSSFASGIIEKLRRLEYISKSEADRARRRVRR